MTSSWIRREPAINKRDPVSGEVGWEDVCYLKVRSSN
jgi:hypothetical protein